ncbi:MAG: HAMP domain-containing histidine kinase [Clostridiales bacterium]|nr:HAMP domain-containing histidine kinase [Clostridiales bacterium]
MIKKAQTRFIILTLSLLLVVFGIIFGASYVLMREVHERGIEHTLNDIESHYQTNDEISSQHAFIAKVIFSSQENVVLNIIKSDNTSLLDSNIDNVINYAMKSSYKTGSIGNMYYKIVDKTNFSLIIASDFGDVNYAFDSNITNTLFMLSLIYLGLSIIVVLVSFSIFRPIKDVFNKQKQFISNASHELKTPLAIISANAEVLKSQNGNNSFIDSINSQSERMELLISDLLTLAKMDEEKMPLSSVVFNISEVIINNSLAFDSIAFEKGKTLNLFVQPDVQYKGDIKSVNNILNILLDNAVKHAKSGGEINVYFKKENSKLSLTIYNTGSNVPESDVNKIFERFYRGDSSRSRESGGSGLGLSIAKSIADNNKWKISAKSKLNEYMAITILF